MRIEKCATTPPPPDVIEVIDEWRWRSARVPRPIFSGETWRRYIATLSLARAGFPGFAFMIPQLAITAVRTEGMIGQGRKRARRARFYDLVRYAPRCINERTFIKVEIVFSAIVLIVDPRTRSTPSILRSFFFTGEQQRRGMFLPPGCTLEIFPSKCIG